MRKSLGSFFKRFRFRRGGSILIGFLDRYLSMVIRILVSSAVVLFKSFDKETQFKITLRKWRDFEKVTLGCTIILNK